MPIKIRPMFYDDGDKETFQIEKKGKKEKEQVVELADARPIKNLFYEKLDMPPENMIKIVPMEPKKEYYDDEHYHVIPQFRAVIRDKSTNKVWKDFWIEKRKEVDKATGEEQTVYTFKPPL